MKRRLVCTLMIFFILGLTACGKEKEAVSYESSVSEIKKDEVMERPGNMTVTHAGKHITARMNSISWAYAVNEEEWSSINVQYDEAIDGPYDEKLVVTSDTTDFLLTFDSLTSPKAIVHVYRYPIENWIEDTDAEEEGHKLREAIEHWDDYDEYEEMAITKVNDTSFVIKTNGTDIGGYIYEVKAAWDTNLYRGSCTYSFMVTKPETETSEE